MNTVTKVTLSALLTASASAFATGNHYEPPKPQPAPTPAPIHNSVTNNNKASAEASSSSASKSSSSSTSNSSATTGPSTSSAITGPSTSNATGGNSNAAGGTANNGGNTVQGGDITFKNPVQIPTVPAPNVYVGVSGDCPKGESVSFSLLVVAFGKGESGVDYDCLRERLDSAERAQDKANLFAMIQTMLLSGNDILKANALSIFRRNNEFADEGTKIVVDNILNCKRTLLDSDAAAVLGSQPGLDCSQIPGPKVVAVTQPSPPPVEKKTVKRSYKAAAAPAPATTHVTVNVGCNTNCPQGTGTTPAPVNPGTPTCVSIICQTQPPATVPAPK